MTCSAPTNTARDDDASILATGHRALAITDPADEDRDVIDAVLCGLRAVRDD
ncbi:hypothetical protein ACWEKT_20705 [Nocardia takedensis]